jgi:DNA-binding winged helix-turn-helix (wHTH) protein/Tol biopolymer transport system component
MRWSVGSYCFDDQSNELEYNQQSLLLEPKPAALLHYFIKNRGKDISRDELMKAVWPNQIVSENAINRVIVQLRKALDDSEKVKRYIVTVPKIGYRFIANCDQIDESMDVGIKASSTLVQQKVGFTKKQIQVSILFFTVLIVAVSYIGVNRFINSKQQYVSPNITPLTRFSEAEFDAELAHDNQQFVYTSRKENGFSHIMYKASANSEPYPISLESGNAYNPRWSADDTQLVYLYQTQDTCEFHIVRFQEANPQPPESIYTCPVDNFSKLAFANDNDIIYFTEKPSSYSPYSVFQIDLKNNNKQRLAQPQSIGLGNYYLDYNRNNNQLLVLNETTIGKSSVFSLDIQKNTYKKLIDLAYRVDSAVWGHESGTLVHPGIHPSYQLTQTDIKDGSSKILLSDTRRISTPKRINNNKDYLFTSYLNNRDINLSTDKRININSSVMDYIPAISHDENYLAFVSKRTGFSQVWLYSFERKKLQVFESQNDGRMFYSLDWSFDDQKILANTTLGLMILDTVSLTIAQEIIPTSPSFASGWYSNKVIRYTTNKGNKWQLHQYELDSKMSKTLDEQWAFSISNQSETILVNQKQETKLLGEIVSLVDLCGPIINRHSFNIRYTESGLYCPAADNPSDLIHINNQGEKLRLKNSIKQTPFYSIGKTMIANIELKDSVSDIMRTNFNDD